MGIVPGGFEPPSMADFGHPTGVSDETDRDRVLAANADGFPPKAIMIGHYTTGLHSTLARPHSSRLLFTDSSSVTDCDAPGGSPE